MPASSGQAGADEQFNKKKSYDSDDGSGKIASVDSKPGSVGKVGSSGMKDEQFDSHLQDAKITSAGKLGSKSSGGKPGSFDGQDQHPAASIMREIAKALQKGPGPDQSYQGNKKVSSPKSPSQTKSYKGSSNNSPQARSKSQLTQKIKKV